MHRLQRIRVLAITPLLFSSAYLLHWGLSRPSTSAFALMLAAPLVWAVGAYPPRTAVWFRRAALVLALFSGASVLTINPLRALSFLCFITGLLFWSESAPDRVMLLRLKRRLSRKPLDERLLAQQTNLMVLASAVAVAFLTVAFGAGGDLIAFAFAVLALVIGYAAILLSSLPRPYRGARRVQLVTLAVFFALGIALVFLERLSDALAVLAAPAAISFALSSMRGEAASPFHAMFLQPARSMVLSFLLASLAGAALLLLPFATTREGGLHFVDALFTAVSAVCVTGLIVLDTPNDFTFIGQLIILCLIQLGGLGVMTFYGVAISFLRHRLSIRHEGAFLDIAGEESRSGLYQFLRMTIAFTAVCELIGIILLFPAFLAAGDNPFQALWRAIFTSVSAFCNAGFALQSLSLEPYQSTPLVLYTVAALIIVGGLSAVVVLSIPKVLRGRRVGLREMISLKMTVLLIAIGFAATLLFEWQSSLSGFSVTDKIHNAFFHSVTLRTAGFNSFDMSALQDETLVLMMSLMFIGGAPGGTAGGIKLTTVYVLVASVIRIIRSRPAVEAYGRTIPQETVNRAAAVLFLGIAVFVFAITSLQLIEELPFRTALFEVVSALGTVGLSLGGTALLQAPGKLLIVLCMFLGRVGPLTAFLVLSHESIDTKGRYPEEKLLVG